MLFEIYRMRPRLAAPAWRGVICGDKNAHENTQVASVERHGQAPNRGTRSANHVRSRPCDDDPWTGWTKRVGHCGGLGGPVAADEGGIEGLSLPSDGLSTGVRALLLPLFGCCSGGFARLCLRVCARVVRRAACTRCCVYASYTPHRCDFVHAVRPGRLRRVRRCPYAPLVSCEPAGP